MEPFVAIHNQIFHQPQTGTILYSDTIVPPAGNRSFCQRKKYEKLFPVCLLWNHSEKSETIFPDKIVPLVELF